MAKLQTISSRDTDQGTVYDFRCPYPTGCGESANPAAPFTSTGWFLRRHAAARGAQHIAEHETRVPMPSLADFWAEQGLTQETAGVPDYSL